MLHVIEKGAKNILQETQFWQQKKTFTKIEKRKDYLTLRTWMLLDQQMCLAEYKAEIENNVESFMKKWECVYEELRKSYN